MSIYDEFRDLATSLMADEFGAEAKLVRVTSTHDRLTDVRNKQEASIPCLAVVAPRKTRNDDGSVTITSMATINVEPVAGDRLLIGSKTYTIGEVTEIAPDGSPIIWKAELRS